jgi:uncharacterized membrane protein YdcZ (DUF606 family)
MNYKIAPNFFCVVIALIVGAALYKQFDFQNFTVENPVLAIIYAIVFIGCIVFMIKKPKNK